MTIFQSKHRIVQAAVAIIVVVTAFRLWFCPHLELVPDEAYYWLWGKHFDLCYRDKGPGVAWVIALSTWIAGDTVFGVRWLGVLIAAATGWQIFRLGQRLYDDKTGLYALLLALVLPLFAVGSVLMTIDTLSVFCWALGSNLAWKAAHSARMIDWIFLGAVIGVGILAKFTNIVQLASLTLFLFWSREKIAPHLLRRAFVLLLTTFVVASPILIWNVENNWPNYGALSSRSGLNTGFGLHFDQLLGFFQLQAIVISPLLYIAILAAVIGSALARTKDDRLKFLLSDFLPLYLCFTFFSLNVAGKGNWTAPAFVPGLVLAVVYWRPLLARFRGWRIAAYFVLGFALVETVLLHDTRILHLSARRDPMTRTRGWESLAAHTQKWRDVYHPDAIIGNHYSQASELAFYLKDRPVTYTPANPHIENQFDLWPGYNLTPHSTFLFVTDSNDPLPESLRDHFSQIKLVDDFYSEWEQRPIRQFKIYVLTNE